MNTGVNHTAPRKNRHKSMTSPIPGLENMSPRNVTVRLAIRLMAGERDIQFCRLLPA